MLPIRDTIESKNYPVVNILIIGTNVLVYLVQLAQGAALQQFILTYGLVPARYSISEIASYFSVEQQVLSFFSFMFVHGGFWHLLGNMWSLYIFGDNIEDRLGHLRYLLFYILCGLLSGISHLLLNFYSQIPTVGASGAIAGVMGAYLILFPKSRILTFIPIFIIPYFIEVPAFIFLGLWFILQFISAAGSPAQAGGVAWWAHIGGFLFGIIFLKLFLHGRSSAYTSRLRHKTARRKTPRLQVIRTVGKTTEPHLYGTISITFREAKTGTRKLVNIPWGFQKRLFMVKVPSNVKEGTQLRLAGMGRQIDEHSKGDLYLRVSLRLEKV